MAKKSKPVPVVEDPAAHTHEIVYIGPDKAESPVFGLLVVGQRYQAEATFAAYLLERHPDHWQRPDAVSAGLEG